MSIQFSSTATKDGIIQQIEQACGFDDGGITSNSVRMAQFTGKVNVAQDEVFAFALNNSGWNTDDFNHTKDPFITTALVSGQRDYHFTVDQEGSIILDIFRVMCRGSETGQYELIKPIDQQSDLHVETFYNGQDSTGTPWRYDKTGNGIFLDPIPNFNSTDGLKLFINRESTYFLVSDTTKLSGIDTLCHDFLYLKPAYEYARDNGLSNRETLFRDMQVAWKKIENRYSMRERDVRVIATSKKIRFR